MHGRFTLLLHSDPALHERLAGALGAPGGRPLPDMSLWGLGAPVLTSADGRAVGVRTGVLFNLDAIAAELSARGVPLDRLDGDGLDGDRATLELVAQRGPQGLARLRRHGALCVVHKAQGGALLVGDCVGLATVWLRSHGAGTVAGSTQAGTQEAARALGWPEAPAEGLPIGEARLLSARGAQVLRWEPAEGAGPALRHRPEAWVAATEGDAIVEAALREAVAAWQRDRGPLAAPGAPALEGLGARGGPSAVPWSPLGLASLAEPAPERDTSALQTLAAQRWGPGWRPPEPEAREAEPRRAARWWRYVEGAPTWRAAAEAAAEREAPIALPHLDPAVLACLGALPHATVRRLTRFTAG